MYKNSSVFIKILLFTWVLYQYLETLGIHERIYAMRESRWDETSLFDLDKFHQSQMLAYWYQEKN